MRAAGFVIVAGAVALAACDPPMTPISPVTPDAGPTASAASAPTTTTPLPLVVDDALINGVLPAGPERDLAMGRCVICHTEQYLTQQRLTPAQWQKTVDKMRRWGAVLSDVEGAQLALWLGRHYPPDLPERRAQVTAAPTGATSP